MIKACKMKMIVMEMYLNRSTFSVMTLTLYYINGDLVIILQVLTIGTRYRKKYFENIDFVPDVKYWMMKLISFLIAQYFPN